MEFRILDMFQKGGFIMWVILALSVIGMAFTLERMVVIRRMIKLIASAKRSAYLDDLKELRDLIVAHIDLAIDEIEMLLEGRLSGLIRTLEKRLTTISVIAQTATLLGLLGTVIGIIKTFIPLEDMETRISPQVLAGGIWEALLTTAFGLTVAIPMLFAFSYLDRAVDEIASEIKEISTEIIKEERLKLSEKSRMRTM